MTKSLLVAAVFFTGSIRLLNAQGSAPAKLNSQPSAKTAAAAPTAAKAAIEPRTAKSPAENTAAVPAGSPAGPSTTEIFADEASFDSAKYIGVFTGHVVVNDPRFNVQSDKMTIYINKQEKEGLEKAIAEGNVAVVRDRPDPKGGPPSRAVGRAGKAVYTAKDGNVELSGSPRVQQGLNTHVATSPDTVMILNEAGHLQTHGPSRTEIRQEPKSETPKP